MAAFSVPGIGGSGLNIPEMLAQLQKAESQKLNPYLLKQDSYNNQVSSWGKISSSLDTLKTTLGKLQDEGFNGVSLGDNKTFKATAGKGAIPNSYGIVVKQLATAHKIGTAAQAKKDELLGDSAATRTLTITTGDGKKMDVELKKDETSLEQVAKKINAQNGEVTAEVRAADNGKFKLVLTSKKTGEDGEMTVSVTGDSKLAEVLDYDPAKPNNDPAAPGYDPKKAGLMVAAKNAEIEIDGEPSSHSSNTISDAITGITLELREVSPDDGAGDPKAETLSVTADTSKVKSLIEEFVKNYNSFLSAAGTASLYKEPEKNVKEGELVQPNKDNGALFGDGTLRRLTSQMKSSVGGNFGESSDVFATLGSLGITVKFDGNVGDDRTGTLGVLSIDNKKLDAALKDNPKEVEALFLGKGGAEGLKDRMDGVFKTYLGDSESVSNKEGAIDSAIKGLKAQEKRVAAQIANVERRIEESLKRSEKEFLRLDKAMSEMNNMSQQLQSALLGIMG
ncbi:flagellar filament capping protein FliD [Scandinavium sp. NPDC088450]|uniref:flagellar filament capping protein FliD n=1 Tax=Scandinavium sp. NPDC088450 TaxID=3364514 RepID=UPI00384D4754